MTEADALGRTMEPGLWGKIEAGAPSGLTWWHGGLVDWLRSGMRTKLQQFDSPDRSQSRVNPTTEAGQRLGDFGREGSYRMPA